MATPAVIDRDTFVALQQMVGDDPGFLNELIDEYLDNTTQLLLAMRQALAANDSAVLRRSAHTLKSNSASFGASALATLCRTLEARGETSPVGTLATLVTQIEDESARVRAALQVERPGEG